MTLIEQYVLTKNQFEASAYGEWPPHCIIYGCIFGAADQFVELQILEDKLIEFLEGIS